MGLYDSFMAHRNGFARPKATSRPSVGSGGLSGAFRGPGEASSRYISQYLLPQEQYRGERAGNLQGQYDAALSDPTAQANKFTDFFKHAAESYAAQANRDFGQTLARTQANTAARFGGNASSEESRNVYNTSDLFARNLTENLSKLAPEAASMGLQYTSQLGQAAGQAQGEYDDLSRLILSGIGMFPQPKPKGNSLLGGITGAALGYLKGGPVGAVAGGVRGATSGG